jgi:hypothetical protein
MCVLEMGIAMEDIYMYINKLMMFSEEVTSVDY